MRIIRYSLLLATSYVLISCASFKNEGLDDFYKKYDQEIVSMRLPKMLFQFNDAHKELKPLKKYLKASRFAMIENANSKMLHDLDKALKNDRYEEYISINNEGNLITLLAAENNEKITHIVCKINESEEVVLLQARVDLPLDKFQEIISSLN